MLLGEISYCDLYVEWLKKTYEFFEEFHTPKNVSDAATLSLLKL